MAQDTLVTGTLESANEALRNASALAENLPSLVESERVAAIEALHTELALLVEAFDTQRTATLAVFSAELRVMIDALVQERVLVGQGLTAERVATLEAMAPLVNEAIDRAFQRATQLLIAVSLFAVVLVSIVTFGLLRYFRSTRPKPDP